MHDFYRFYNMADNGHNKTLTYVMSNWLGKIRVLLSAFCSGEYKSIELCVT